MVRVRFRGRFRWQLIIDSCMPVHDPPESGSSYWLTMHDQKQKQSNPIER